MYCIRIYSFAFSYLCISLTPSNNFLETSESVHLRLTRTGFFLQKVLIEWRCLKAHANNVIMFLGCFG